jgi:hypothetical protein
VEEEACEGDCEDPVETGGFAVRLTGGVEEFEWVGHLILVIFILFGFLKGKGEYGRRSGSLKLRICISEF